MAPMGDSYHITGNLEAVDWSDSCYLSIPHLPFLQDRSRNGIVVAFDTGSLVYIIVSQGGSTHNFDDMCPGTACQTHTTSSGNVCTFLLTQGGTVPSKVGDGGLLRIVVEGAKGHHLERLLVHVTS